MWIVVKMALDYKPKKIICIDCGNEFYLDNPMAGRTYRCEECQKEANKERYRKYNKKRRSWPHINFRRNNTKIIVNC